MKKLVISVVAALSYFTAASAEVGVNVGVSGQLGLFAASAKEVDTGPNITETAQDTELAGVGYGSVFIEKDTDLYRLNSKQFLELSNLR